MRIPTPAALALVVVAAALAVLVSPGTAQACSCAEASTERHVAGADVVFVGALVDRADIGLPWQTGSNTRTRYLFDVDEVVKGEVHERQAVVSFGDGGNCGMELFGDGPYVIYAARHGEDHRSDLCSGNTEMNPALARELHGLADEAARLLPGASEDSGWWTPSRLLGGGTALFGAALVGLLLARRHLRHRGP